MKNCNYVGQNKNCYYKNTNLFISIASISGGTKMLTVHTLEKKEFVEDT